jgi:hypothetical protein
MTLPMMSVRVFGEVKSVLNSLQAASKKFVNDQKNQYKANQVLQSFEEQNEREEQKDQSKAIW